jgi:hypothetical protein
MAKQEDNSVFTIGALFALFVIYITSKGELPNYIRLFLYSPPKAASSSSSASSSAQPGAGDGGGGGQGEQGVPGLVEKFGQVPDFLKQFGLGI